MHSTEMVRINIAYSHFNIVSLTEEMTLDRPELQNERLKIPSMAEDEIKTKVTDLNKSFTKLLQSLKKELKEKDVDVTEIVEYLEDSGCGHLPFDDLKTSNNFRELLTKVGDYYDFLDCELLEMIAEEYASEELAEKFKVHSSEAQKFRQSNSVCQLKECLQQIFNPYVDDLEKGPKAHIDLNNAWNQVTINRLSVLIRCFFPNTDRHALTKHITVTCSSVHITYFMTESPDQIQQVIACARERVAFMKYIGLYRLIINGETILDESEKEDFSFNSALIEAAGVGQSEAVEVLLQLGSGGSDVLGNISQALLDACDNGHYQVVKLLLDEKADSNVKKECGRTALYLASRNGHHKVVELLLKAKADPNIQSLEGVTPLYMASQNGYHQVVELLLKANADPNIKENDGWTALMLASQEGHYQIVRLLLERNADPNIMSDDGCTAIAIASQNGHLPVVELLLKANADPNIKVNNGGTVLMIASQKGHYQIVRLLLESNADPNIMSENGRTAITIASHNGHLPVVELLLNANADPNVKVNDGWTALMIASQEGHYQVVKLLLERNADPNIMSDDGCTAIVIASQKGHLPVVELLFKENADSNLQNSDRTALVLASLNNRKEVVSFLIKEQDDHGFTALMSAIYSENIDIVLSLLETGIMTYVDQAHIQAAIKFSTMHSKPEITELLRYYAIDVHSFSEEDLSSSEIHTIISATQVESQDIDSVNTLPYSNKEIGQILMQDTDEDSLIKHAPSYQKHSNQLAAGESYQPSSATSFSTRWI